MTRIERMFLLYDFLISYYKTELFYIKDVKRNFSKVYSLKNYSYQAAWEDIRILKKLKKVKNAEKRQYKVIP